MTFISTNLDRIDQALQRFLRRIIYQESSSNFSIYQPLLEGGSYQEPQTERSTKHQVSDIYYEKNSPEDQSIEVKKRIQKLKHTQLLEISKQLTQASNSQTKCTHYTTFFALSGLIMAIWEFETFVQAARGNQETSFINMRLQTQSDEGLEIMIMSTAFFAVINHILRFYYKNKCVILLNKYSILLEEQIFAKNEIKYINSFKKENYKVQTESKLVFLFELIILGICPLPFFDFTLKTATIKATEDGVEDQHTYQLLDDYLFILMFYKLYFLFLSLQNYHNNSYRQYIYQKYSVTNDFRFMTRQGLFLDPIKSFSFCFLIYLPLFLYSYRVTDLNHCFSLSDYENIEKQGGLISQTTNIIFQIMTFGFYDHIALSSTGKILEQSANIFGIIFVLTTFLVFLNQVSLSKNEQNAIFMVRKVVYAQKVRAKSWIFYKSKKEQYKNLIIIKPDLDSDFVKRLKVQYNQDPQPQAGQDSKKVESDLKKAKKLWKQNQDYLQFSIQEFAILQSEQENSDRDLGFLTSELIRDSSQAQKLINNISQDQNDKNQDIQNLKDALDALQLKLSLANDIKQKKNSKQVNKKRENSRPNTPTQRSSYRQDLAEIVPSLTQSLKVNKNLPPQAIFLNSEEKTPERQEYPSNMIMDTPMNNHNPQQIFDKQDYKTEIMRKLKKKVQVSKNSLNTQYNSGRAYLSPPKKDSVAKELKSSIVSAESYQAQGLQYIKKQHNSLNNKNSQGSRTKSMM